VPSKLRPVIHDLAYLLAALPSVFRYFLRLLLIRLARVTRQASLQRRDRRQCTDRQLTAPHEDLGAPTEPAAHAHVGERPIERVPAADLAPRLGSARHVGPDPRSGDGHSGLVPRSDASRATPSVGWPMAQEDFFSARQPVARNERLHGRVLGDGKARRREPLPLTSPSRPTPTKHGRHSVIVVGRGAGRGVVPGPAERPWVVQQPGRPRILQHP